MTAYTPSLRLAEPVPGDPAVKNSWGTILNTNDALIESAITGVAVVPIGGETTYSLTTANGAADQARPLVQFYTGALTANCTVTLPNVPKIGWAINSTTGGHSVILTAGSGTTVTIPPGGSWYWYQADGAGNVGFPTIGYSSITTAGALTVGGLATLTGGAVLPNNVFLWAKDTGGTARALVGLASNNYSYFEAGSGGFIISTQGGGSALISGTAAGAVNVLGSLTVGGVAVLTNYGTWTINITGTAAAATNATYATSAGYATTAGSANALASGADIGVGDFSASGSANFTGGTAGTASGWTMNYLGTFAASGPYTASIYAINSIATSAGFFALSDARVKSGVTTIPPEDGRRFVLTSRPVVYIKNGVQQAGFIAQEQHKAGYAVAFLPHEGLPETVDDDGYVSPANIELTLDYNERIALLTAALQDAFARIDALEDRRRFSLAGLLRHWRKAA